MGQCHLRQAALQMLPLYTEISRQKQTAVKGLKRPYSWEKRMSCAVLESKPAELPFFTVQKKKKKKKKKERKKRKKEKTYDLLYDLKILHE